MGYIYGLGYVGKISYKKILAKKRRKRAMKKALANAKRKTKKIKTSMAVSAGLSVMALNAVELQQSEVEAQIEAIVDGNDEFSEMFREFEQHMTEKDLSEEDIIKDMEAFPEYDDEEMYRQEVIASIAQKILLQDDIRKDLTEKYISSNNTTTETVDKFSVLETEETVMKGNSLIDEFIEKVNEEKFLQKFEAVVEEKRKEAAINEAEKILENELARQEGRLKQFQIDKKEQEEWVKQLRAERKAKRKARERARAKAEAEAKAKAEAEARAKAEAEAKVMQQGQFAHLANEETLLARIIFCEAGYNIEDKIYVASVVLNRVRTNYRSYRNVHTISEVLNQPGQYACKNKVWTVDVSQLDTELKVAHGLITGEIQCLEEKILVQTTTWQGWMAGHIGTANLPNAAQFYGYPLDFESGCK